MSSSPITPEIIAEHGLRPEEYQQILSILGREPSFTELGIFSVMWSEHCSYKNSKPLLKTLPTTGPHVLQGPGENAGVVALDDELAVCFKMESHNHPSAVEPYQGAATGVGGILRDIFTMGARPVALVDCLFFGEPDSRETERIARGVVHGIADYGNCVGVPTVAGQVSFFPCYERNPLVNAMAVGVMRREELTLAKARNAGSVVVYYGNATGRDGVHGATFASVELTEDTMEQRSAVQVGDPFMGKKILEATLELIKSGAVEAIQDMGAAGLTCSGCEIAGRGRLGMELNLDLVPQRAKNMSPYEMMLSESQERMLAVIPPGSIEKAMDVLAKWEVNPAVVGHVTEDGLLTVWHQKMIVAKVPALKISEESPVYLREAREPKRPEQAYQPGASAGTIDVKASLLALLRHPNIASKLWIHQQYDSQVQTNTVLGPGAGAAVLRVDGSKKLLGISTGVDPLKMACDPFMGAQMAVAEAALNLLCVGCKPLGLTDNLNFGNPEKPEQFWALKRAVEGISAMSRALEIPVTGGNVSLYNESPTGPIWPTPTIGMVGAADGVEHVITPGFKDSGDVIYVLGELPSSLAGSLLAYQRDGDVPAPLDAEMSATFTERMVRLQKLLFKLIDGRILKSAQDVSEGGLAVALAECAIFSTNGVGCDVSDFDEEKSFWFGEPGALVVVSIAEADQEKMRDLLDDFEELDFVEVGEVIGEARMVLPGGESVGIDELRKERGTVPAFVR
ncbi:phosphoribosylformylglycinamidine synthase subunit PurL [Candidatus Sumerlaeota bacterium]|nr:phosphoribosylformylglycinamidine synthase subunit PurL [Candidatus Sumerlaeota bacterium]